MTRKRAAKESGIQAVILDWAGTVVDHGSRAPMEAFVHAFAHFGVPITIADARGPMGMAKRDHIRALGRSPAVAAAWTAKFGHSITEDEIDAVMAVFEPLTVSSVLKHADFIPGALEALAKLRSAGIRIGSTTGYTRPIMEKLMPVAASAGYSPEVTVCAGDLPAGRPAPLMMWHAMAAMGVWPAHKVVKVDDTIPGIGEGAAAGTWTVGVSLSGNTTGQTAEEFASLAQGEKAALRARAEAELKAAGADLVIDSIAALPEAIGVINLWLAQGRRPSLS